MNASADSGRTLKKILAWLFLLIAAVYLLSSPGLPYVETGNQFHVSYNLLQRGRLETSAEQGKKIYHDGRAYDYHGLANVLLMLPVAAFDKYALGNQTLKPTLFAVFLASLTGVLTGAFTGLIFFLILIHWEIKTTRAVLATLCLAFLTLLYPYSGNNYEGNLDTLAILGAFFSISKYFENQRAKELVFAGLFAGISLLCRELSLIIFGVFALALLRESLIKKNMKPILFFILGAAPFIFLWGYYNHARTGAFYLSAQMVEVMLGEGKVPRYGLLSGLWRLTLSPSEGMLIYSPVLVYSILGIRRFWQSKKCEVSLILSISILTLLAVAKTIPPQGICSWGPRYTLEITPLLLLPLAFWLDKDGLRVVHRRIDFIVVALFSLSIQLSGTLTHWLARHAYVLWKQKQDHSWFHFTSAQWWDSFQTLLINGWNACFGHWAHLNNPGYAPATSALSLQTAQTLFVWWVRVLHMGVSPWVIVGYLFVSMALIGVAVWKLTAILTRPETAG